MNVCKINGKRYELPDNASVSVVNGKVYVNGKPFADTESFCEKVINITIRGNVNSVENGSGQITVEGDAKNVKTSSGDIKINGSVSGDVSTASGDVECGAVGGNVKTMSGDVKCGPVQGTAKSMSGDITQKSGIIDILKKHFDPLISKRSEFD